MNESDKLQAYTAEDSILAKQKLADILIQAGICKGATTEEVIMKMESAQEFGFRPVFALGKVAVVQGQVYLMGEALLALIKASPVYGGARYWWLNKELAKQDVNEVPIDTNEFFGYAVQFSRRGADDVYTAQFTLGDAKRIGLHERETWKKHYVVMCKWRAVGDAGRVTFPDVIGGLSVTAEAEEVGADIIVTENGDVRVIDSTIEDITPADEEEEGPVWDDDLLVEVNELGGLLGYSAAKVRAEVNKAGKEHLADLVAEWRIAVEALPAESDPGFDKPYEHGSEQRLIPEDKC